MKILPKHILTESLSVWALAFYLAMAMTVLGGIILWLLGEQEVVLKASWIRWCAIIAVVPVALRFVRRINFDRKAWRAGWQKHQLPQRKQRQYPRCSVQYPVRVSTDHGHGAFGMIADLSAKGCRVKSKAFYTPGDFGKLLIYVPTGMTPLTVSLTSVRWVSGHECGLEFILMDLDEQGCLERCLAHAKSQFEPHPTSLVM
jgi:PilZ domain-containing protein